LHGGGSFQLDGKAGPIDPKDSAMTPVSMHAKASQVDLVATGLNDVAPGVAGVVSFDGSGESDGKILKLTGKLHGEKMKLVANGSPATRRSRWIMQSFMICGSIPARCQRRTSILEEPWRTSPELTRSRERP